MILTVCTTDSKEIVFAYDTRVKDDDDNRYLYIDWLVESRKAQVWEYRYWTYRDIDPEEERKFLGYLPSEVM